MITSNQLWNLINKAQQERKAKPLTLKEEVAQAVKELLMSFCETHNFSFHGEQSNSFSITGGAYETDHVARSKNETFEIKIVQNKTIEYAGFFAPKEDYKVRGRGASYSKRGALARHLAVEIQKLNFKNQKQKTFLVNGSTSSIRFSVGGSDASASEFTLKITSKK